MNPLVSIITPVRNERETIEFTIKSVLGQNYKNIEHIIIDSGSTDGTLDIINKYRNNISRLIFEKERGLYRAINSGLKAARGDIIGILNADDIYFDHSVIDTAVNAIQCNNVESCYGDLLYVDRILAEKIIRYWKAGNFSIDNFSKGWMPPHPTFFVKRQIYDKFGYFNTDFEISADYEILLRFLYKYRVTTYYTKKILVKMRLGGLSNKNIVAMFKKSIEDYNAMRLNGLDKIFLNLIMKNAVKIRQFIVKYEHE